MKALVVLADRSQQREIADFFGRRLQADLCESRAQALEAVARTHFPYIVLDASVEGALDVCAAVRQRRDGRESFIIAVLSGPTTAALREAMEAGVDDFVAPPLNISSLQMRMAIAERNLARRLRRTQQATAGDGLVDKRYRTLVQSMHEGVFLVDARGRIEFANTRMSSLSGYTIDELVGQSADELLVDDDFRDRLPGQTLLGSGIGSEEYTLPLRRKDGGHVWVRLVAAPTLSAAGRDGAMGIVRDLTEQHEAEEGLKHREEYFRALLDSSSDLISIIGVDGQVLYQSPSSERMIGLPPEVIVGSDVLSFVHPDDRPAFRNALDASIAGAEPTTAEMRLRRSAGDWLYVESLCANLIDNPVIGGVVVTSRDITERHRVEAALKRERAFFQQLFDKSPTGIVVLNTQDRVVDANRSFVDLFQYEVDDLAGQRLGTSVVPEDRQSEARELAQAVAAGQSVVHETVRRRKDGTDVDVSMVCYPVDVGGRRVGA
ncbi:MAG: PAS domain S-box protein, partial [Acidobacteriota bacterium]